MAEYIGTAGADNFTGTGDVDSFDMSQGGADTIAAGDGGDIISFGGALTATDRIDGGDGFDALYLDGDYSAGLVLAATSLTRVEGIYLAAGHGYSLTLNDANVATGEQLTINALAGAQDVFIDASALVSGGAISADVGFGGTALGGQADDALYADGPGAELHGGGGSDIIVITGTPDKTMRLDGGAGYDFAYFHGDNLDWSVRPNALHDIDMITFFGTNISVKLSNGNVAKDQIFSVNLSTSDDRFDGSAETDGQLFVDGGGGDDTIVGGRGADRLTGGLRDDVLTGGKGGDTLIGQGGADTFLYAKLGDSTAKGPDLITDFVAVVDHIDISLIDARTDEDGDQAFSLAHKFTKVAGQMVLTYDALHNVTNVQGDVNGDGKADLVIGVTGHITDLAGFVL